MLESGEAFSKEDLEKVVQFRESRGIAKLNDVWLRSCWSCANKDMINLWLRIAKRVHGYTDCTGKGIWIAPKVEYGKPVAENPGKPDQSDALSKKERKRIPKRKGG